MVMVSHSDNGISFLQENVDYDYETIVNWSYEPNNCCR